MAEAGRRDAVRLRVKVVPGSSRDAVAGWLGEDLKVRVKAPAEGGRANAAVERLVAEALDVSAEQVRIVAGFTSPRKTLEVSGLPESELGRRLARPGS
jgi:uncharacterized protein (TIGR00251 family)